MIIQKQELQIGSLHISLDKEKNYWRKEEEGMRIEEEDTLTNGSINEKP